MAQEAFDRLITVVSQRTTPSDTQPSRVVTPNGDSAMDETNDAVRVNVVAGGAGDGAILDGVSSSIKASVLDYTNSNPIAVRLTDTNGDYAAAGAGTQYTEDAPAAADPVGSALIMVRDDALSGQTTADGDNVAARGTDKGELYVKHADAIPVTDNGGALTVDGTVAVSGTVTVDTELPAAAALGDNTANPTTPSVGTFPHWYDGATWDRALGNATDGLLVNLGTNNDVTVTGSVTANAGTNLNTSALALESGGNLAGAATSLAVMDDWDNAASDGCTVSGDVAHGSADAGEPVKIGAKVETSPKGITLASDGQRTNLYADADGILLVKGGTAWADLIAERVSNTDGNSTAFSTFDNAANTRNYITSVTIHNSHATTNGYVDLRDGTAGSVIWTFPAPATGGVTHNFDPPLRQPTAATALAYDVSAAISTIYISVNGFKSKV